MVSSTDAKISPNADTHLINNKQCYIKKDFCYII